MSNICDQQTSLQFDELPHEGYRIAQGRFYLNYIATTSEWQLNIPEQYQGLLGFLLFVAAFLLGSYLLSLFSGWHWLAKKYRAKEEPHGESFIWLDAQVGYTPYRGILNINLTPKGMFVSVMFLFSLGHPTLFIPWNDICNEIEEEHLFRRETIRFSIGDPEEGNIRLPKFVMDRRHRAR